jgi:hypothetical protein
VLVVAFDDRARVVAQPAGALDEPEVAGQVVAHPPEDVVVLRRVVEAGLVGVDDRDEPVAIGVAVVGEPVVVQAEGVERLGPEARPVG